jgi:hypothetical protein
MKNQIENLKSEYNSAVKGISSFLEFLKNPYRRGSAVPAFAFHASDGSLSSNEGFTFGYTLNDNNHVVLEKTMEDGSSKKLTIAQGSYERIITNTEKSRSTQDVTANVKNKQEYSAIIEQDMARPNTAYNFWHNLRCQCHSYANNPAEAIAVAKALYSILPKEEKKKFNTQTARYNKLSHETVTDRVTRIYNESIKGHPIKNKGVYSFHSLHQNLPYSDVVKTKGQSIDSASSLKIGDQIKLAITMTDFYGKKKELPIQPFIITASSRSLNKISLLSPDGMSKYIMDREYLIEIMNRQEKKLTKETKRLERRQALPCSYGR